MFSVNTGGDSDLDTLDEEKSERDDKENFERDIANVDGGSSGHYESFQGS